LAHHGLIKILIKDALQNLRIPIKWLVFRDLPVEDDIKTLIYDVSPSVMEKEETNTKDHDEREHKEDDVEIEEETDGDEKE